MKNQEQRPLIAIICIIGLFAFSTAQAAYGLPGSQEMLPLTSSVYEMMDALYASTGFGTASNARPWTKREAAQILGRLDFALLSTQETALKARIAEAIRPGLRFDLADGFGFGVSAEANFEAYWHSSTDFNQESDWLYGFEERKPMAKLSLDFSLDDALYLYCDMQYGRNRFNIADDLRYATDIYPLGIGTVIKPTDSSALIALSSSIYSQPFLTNLLEKPVDFNYQWPKRAIASLGGKRWNLSFSRDKVRWGNGHTGNFILDDHVDYQDFIRLVTFSEIFKYDWTILFFDPNTKVGEQPDREFKLLLAHRLEFRIAKTLTFAISENVLYKNDVFDLRYLNPAFIYHNLNNRSIFNSIAHMELDYSFAKGFNFYAQMTMDQARAPTESSAQADAKGYLGGLEYVRLIGSGCISSSLEFALTDPLLYRRDGFDFVMMRKYYTNGDPTGPGYIISFDYPGFRFGGDALVAQWELSYRVPENGRLTLTVFGMRHGEMDFYRSHNNGGDNTGFADYMGKTPSGDAIEDRIAASLSGNYEIPKTLLWGKVNLWFHTAWVTRSIYTKSSATRSSWSSDLQITAGCSFTL